MIFVLSVLLTYFICLPGLYVILRLRLGANVLEVIAGGFFLGFALVVLLYEALSWYLPVPIIDYLLWSGSTVALIVGIRELNRQRLPIWIARDYIQMLVVGFALLFMLVLAFGDLTSWIDDDVFIHMPIVKRISMGDIPPHMPYFPDSYLRGHIGRDLFTGTIARFLDLRPEIAIIYVTLAICPAYILMFHALAWRLSSGSRIATAFCFFGMLFLVSFSIGPYNIRAGSITYAFNNHAFAWSYPVFIGWLLQRSLAILGDRGHFDLSDLQKNALLLVTLVIGYTALYFIYISNFLFISLFLVTMPLLFAIGARSNRLRRALEIAAGVLIVIAGSALLQLAVSPFFAERVMVSIGVAHTHEPIGFIQQAHLTFPKQHPFTITAPSGDDVPFFTRDFLSAQGWSFYIGLLGLFIGLITHNLAIAASSLFGWLVMSWLLLVDMGEYRAESLRVLLAAHMGFGTSTGLMIGLGLEHLLQWVGGRHLPGLMQKRWSALLFPGRSFALVTIAIAIGVCAWMGRGNAEKFMAARHWDLATSSERMAALIAKDPEKWNDFLNMRRIDFEAIQLLQDRVKSPNKRAMLRLLPDDQFKGSGDAVNRTAVLINAAAMTGAGIVGMTQEHAPPHMDVAIFPYDYRASLFWQQPTADLLDQLSPDWILLNSGLVPPPVLAQIMALPGISLVRTLRDNSGEGRMLLHYAMPARQADVPSQVLRVTTSIEAVKTTRFGLVRLPVTIETNGPGAIKLVMEVADANGQTVNVMDIPLVPVTPLGGDRYECHFSMIQAGVWNIYFKDPMQRIRLNAAPLKVEVEP